MVKKSKGRQKIEMVKMKNESNLQVTFSKRRSGLFKKASELCTLCGAEVVIIVFSPGRKVFSFGHPNVESIIDRFLNNNPRSPHHNNIQLSETRRNSIIHDLNTHLTQVLNQLESEKKKNEELKKLRENTKTSGNWWEDPVEGLELTQVNEFKGNLENLKRIVTFQASKFFQTTVPNFYVGSSSNAAFGVDDGSHHNPNLDMFGQRRMVDINALNYNQIPIQPSNFMVNAHALPFGNSTHNNITEGYIPEHSMNYNLEYNPNQNQNQNQTQNQIFKRENISDYEHHHGPLQHSRSGYY